MARSSKRKTVLQTEQENNQKTLPLEARLNLLEPGGTLLLAKTATSRTFVERSGRGDKVRFVRETTRDGNILQEVFREAKF
jgi:hypothetical protein